MSALRCGVSRDGFPYADEGAPGNFAFTPPPTERMRSAEQVALEMAEALRNRFGHDLRHPEGRRWLAACIVEARHEMAVELGLSDRPRPGPVDFWRLNRDG